MALHDSFFWIYDVWQVVRNFCTACETARGCSLSKRSSSIFLEAVWTWSRFPRSRCTESCNLVCRPTCKTCKCDLNNVSPRQEKDVRKETKKWSYWFSYREWEHCDVWSRWCVQLTSFLTGDEPIRRRHMKEIKHPRHAKVTPLPCFRWMNIFTVLNLSNA